MSKFLPGLFVGAAIALLIAPKKGEEMRLELSERWKDVKNKLTDSSSAPLNTTSTDDGSPIILPVDTLAAAKPSSAPLSTNETPLPGASRASVDSIDSTSTTKTSAIDTTASISTTMPAKQYKYNESTEDVESAPITTPVETFKAMPADPEITEKRSDISYRNPGKAGTTSRWFSNSQHKRG